MAGKVSDRFMASSSPNLEKEQPLPTAWWPRLLGNFLEQPTVREAQQRFTQQRLLGNPLT
jgi:hypothetical protein